MARRIYHRLCQEYGYYGGERPVREYVRKRTQLWTPGGLLPLGFSRAEWMQVDWGMAAVKVQGETR